MNSNFNKIASLMLCFFCMGFVDLVGIASNYVKADLNLTDAQANIFPSLVFFWFLIFSVPTGMLMNRIGRKNMVKLSLYVTFIALLIPIASNSFAAMLIAFSLLGIGNTLMQTSLNPLVANVISGDKLASSLTFGQFIKAIASFLAPYIAMWGATHAIPSLGLEWRILFPIYMTISIVAVIILEFTRITETTPTKQATSISSTFKLLTNKGILMCFIGIVCHVGIDVGINTTAPKILIERVDMTLAEASFATSLYFIFRTIGCLSGSFILRHISERSFLIASVVFMIISMGILAISQSQNLLYVAIALIGLGNSNVFPICFSQALLTKNSQQNEISGLMIMGLFGGTIFPLVMGFASDAIGQIGAVIVMSIGVLYLLFFSQKMSKQHE
ncbi:MAG: sugar MFS transporter [Bacteroidales bacterium]|nr:sugar MFS transporter [Bacteroidales bacterium]